MLPASRIATVGEFLDSIGVQMLGRVTSDLY